LPALKYFTQSSILRQIGYRRLAILLAPFRDELILRNLTLPVPDPQNDDYFADLANALSATESLPHSLRKALFTIEVAASPENNTFLSAAINSALRTPHSEFEPPRLPHSAMAGRDKIR